MEVNSHPKSIYDYFIYFLSKTRLGMNKKRNRIYLQEKNKIEQIHIEFLKDKKCFIIEIANINYSHSSSVL
jgi:hypothetical protein